MESLNFNNEIGKLIKYHYKNCQIYKKFIDKLKYNKKDNKLSNIPFLPVNLFKTQDLLSISKNKVVKILNSSGTTGVNKSKIYLDKRNSFNQKKVLNEIVSELIGPVRLPMLIIDQNPNKKKAISLEAREAGILGFSIFGKNHLYILNKNQEIDYKKLNMFLKEFGNNSFLIFGFTSNIFKYLIENIKIKKLNKNFANGILFHGGGWKKMHRKKIDNLKFRSLLNKKLMLKNIYNYYGLVEQTGSIFFECQICNSFYTSKYSDIIIRDKKLNVLKKGRGLIQLLSILPTSYPGHSILTEDEGELVNNNCECKKKGKQFKIFGRIKKSEIRGCSDI